MISSWRLFAWKKFHWKTSSVDIQLQCNGCKEVVDQTTRNLGELCVILSHDRFGIEYGDMMIAFTTDTAPETAPFLYLFGESTRPFMLQGIGV